MTKTMDTPTGLPRRAVLAAGIMAIGLAGAVRAEAAEPALVALRVIDRETGQEARVWHRAGRLFVAGQPGQRYSLRVINNTPGRVLVVMSVDGVNILTGETAGFGQRGYVFAPYETYDVSGWRKSDTEVAAFNFAPLQRSYAAQTGRPGDVGVIGIAAFSERFVPPPAPAARSNAPASRDKSATDTLDEAVIAGSLGGSAAAAQKSEKLGTEHGAREWSSVTTVAFERARSYPEQISRIEYDSTANLIAIGVIPAPRPTPPPRPRPFPASRDRPGYVPDPPYAR